MSNFNNADYEDMIVSIISDEFYVKDSSISNKLMVLRKYAEVVLRKLFDIPNTQKVMLGDSAIQAKIKTKGNPLLENAIENLRRYGNDNMHTKKMAMPTLVDLESAQKSLIDLYASIFIDYFEKYRFGTNDAVMGAFSILPPVIRYTTLSYLHKNDSDNIAIIDKLALATLKTYSKDVAVQWLNDEKIKLEKLSVATKEADDAFIAKVGEKTAQVIFSNRPQNMYVMCMDKIENVSKAIDAHGKLYTTFEEAKKLYEQKGVLQGGAQEIKDFNSIMEFCYMGRREELSEYKDLSKYTVADFKVVNRESN